MNPVFGNESARLEISGRDGHIVALQYGGENLLLESSAAFALRLLEVATGEYRFFSSADFTHYSFIGNFSRWTGCAGYADLTVECKISFDGRFFRFRPAVSNIPPEFWVDLIEMPQVVVRYENELFWSHCGGCLAREPWLSERKFKQIGFPGDSDLNIYPGSCQMQFFASWGKKYGLYFAADDYSHSTKDLELSPDGGGRIRLRMECTWGEAGMGGTAVLPFDLVLGGFSGDWQDACEIYRDWVKKDPGMERKITLPKWLDESPVVVVYPVCGNGTIAPEPNRFQPYDRAFPRIKELSEALDSPIMVHLMRWDHNGPWLPPYHWPPVGDIEAFSVSVTCCMSLATILASTVPAPPIRVKAKATTIPTRIVINAKTSNAIWPGGPRARSTPAFAKISAMDTICVFPKRGAATFCANRCGWRRKTASISSSCSTRITAANHLPVTPGIIIIRRCRASGRQRLWSNSSTN